MRVLYAFSLLGLFCWVPFASAQQVGTCVPAQADAYLDVGNVRARLLNDGPLFWRGNPATYEVPKGGGTSGIFVTSLWVGGTVNNELRVAAARYGNFEFWPGPLDQAGNPPADCSDYDRIFRISLEEIQAYNRTGQATPDLAEWPAHLGAPVSDGDGNPDNYDLEAGDRPALMGDQMAWWVMNDRGNTHQSSGSLPIGLEVQVTAFAYNMQGAIGNSTFYQYKLIYKGDQPFEDAYVGFYADPDFGNFADDYIGVDTTLQLAYVYNADNNDEGNYGVNPPALGYLFLDGLVVDNDGLDNNRDGTIDEPKERWGMDSSVCMSKGGHVLGEPTNAQEYYHILQGRFRGGQPMTFEAITGGRTPHPIPIRYCYTGKPEDGAFWTEINADGAGTSNSPSDKRFSFASGPFHMDPGDSQTITFAIVWSQGADYLDSVRQLRKDAAFVRAISEDLYSLNPRNLTPPPQKAALPRPVLSFASNYPNPFNEHTTIRYSLPISASVHLAVYDALGQEVTVLVDRQQPAEVYTVPFSAKDLPPGIYFYRLVLNEYHTFTKAMLLVR